MSSKNNDEEHVKHSETDDKEIMINDVADEDTEGLFQSIFPRSQVALETSMKVSDFVCDCVYLLH